MDVAQPQDIAIGTELQVAYVKQGGVDQERTMLAFERSG
jgi:hypothetical protein